MTHNYQFNNGILVSVTPSTASYIPKQYTFINGLLTNVRPSSASAGNVSDITFINGIFTGFTAGSGGSGSSGSSSGSTSGSGWWTFNFDDGPQGWICIDGATFGRWDGSTLWAGRLPDDFGDGFWSTRWKYFLDRNYTTGSATWVTGNGSYYKTGIWSGLLNILLHLTNNFVYAFYSQDVDSGPGTFSFNTQISQGNIINYVEFQFSGNENQVGCRLDNFHIEGLL